MQRTMVTYTFRLGDDAVEAWHKRVAEFIAQIENDPRLKGNISYRCLKGKGGVYYHLAESRDDASTQALVQTDWFKSYTAETKRVAGGEVLVAPLETIVETQPIG